MSEQLLTARTVATMLDVHAETVLRWTRDGKLPAVRLPGGAIRYQPAAIEECLAAWATTTGDNDRSGLDAVPGGA